MFDMLTADELAALHTKLCHAHMNVHHKLLDRDTGQPVIPVFSDDWQILSAHADEMNEMAAAVYAEIHRRAEQYVPAGCCRHCVHGPGYVHVVPCLVCPQEACADA